MSDYNPKNDRWLESRLIWMRDNQPGRLRELMQDPAKLVALLIDAVQTARRVWWEAEQAGTDPSDAQEMALAVLCPAEEPDPDRELPLAQKEWAAIQQAVRSAPVEM